VLLAGLVVLLDLLGRIVSRGRLNHLRVKSM
jgi:hypothetical protein